MGAAPRAPNLDTFTPFRFIFFSCRKNALRCTKRAFLRPQKEATQPWCHALMSRHMSDKQKQDMSWRIWRGTTRGTTTSRAQLWWWVLLQTRRTTMREVWQSTTRGQRGRVGGWGGRPSRKSTTFELEQEPATIGARSATTNVARSIALLASRRC